MVLSKAYYQNPDVVFLAKDLLGKILHTQIDGAHVSAMITETEAYNGVVDKACHAYGNRRTNRTASMYTTGGHAYVYLCYGIHYLFNVVVGNEDDPKAVLVRGAVMVSGTETVKQRRKHWDDLIGPGKVTQGLGITTAHDLTYLTGQEIWITDPSASIDPKQVQVGPRIGIDYAEEDAMLPYRFWIEKTYARILIEGLAL